MRFSVLTNQSRTAGTFGISRGLWWREGTGYCIPDDSYSAANRHSAYLVSKANVRVGNWELDTTCGWSVASGTHSARDEYGDGAQDDQRCYRPRSLRGRSERVAYAVEILQRAPLYLLLHHSRLYLSA
jgi:hypothetical protein